MSQPRRAAEAAPGAAQSGAEDATGGGRRQPRSRPPSRSRAGGFPAAPRPLSPGPAMGALTSRQNAGVEEVDIPANSVYRYPPKSGEPRGCRVPVPPTREGQRGVSRAGTGHDLVPGGGDPAHPKANADAQGGHPKSLGLVRGTLRECGAGGMGVTPLRAPRFPNLAELT